MTITVEQNLVSSSKYSKKCPYPMEAEYITFHNTYNDAPAENEVKYMIGNDNAVSFHFAIDDKKVVQGVPLNRNAYHCGDGRYGTGNRKSIGVEVCYSKSGGPKYVQAETLAIKFIAQLLQERNWSVDRVKPHQVWSGKFCPHRVLADKRWNEIISRIQTELNSLKGEVTIIYKPAPVVSKGYLEKGDKGSKVTELQTLLEKAGYELGAIDGIFGANTESAVRKLQKDNKLTVDGLAGNMTMQVLEALTSKPASKPSTPTKVGSSKVITVKAGDTLYGIATDYSGVTVEAIKKANNLKSDIINVGDKLVIPSGSKTEAPKPVIKPTTSYSLPNRTYRLNDKGSAVKEIQLALNKLKFNCGTPDGHYGPKTADAVKRFQKVYIPYEVDGVYGSTTRGKMLSELSKRGITK